MLGKGTHRWCGRGSRRYTRVHAIKEIPERQQAWGAAGPRAPGNKWGGSHGRDRKLERLLWARLWPGATQRPTWAGLSA